MTEKQTNKIASCKALQGKSIGDVIATDRFLANLQAVMHEQRVTRAAARKAAAAAGMKLRSHAVDLFVGWTAEEMRAAFVAVLEHRSGRPFRERQYIEQLGRLVLNETIRQYIYDDEDSGGGSDRQ